MDENPLRKTGSEVDGVWLYRPTRTKEKSPKLQIQWQGPYKGKLSAKPSVEEDGGIPGPARILLGNRSGRTASRREQQLESNHRE
jgi:hypothetical protein